MLKIFFTIFLSVSYMFNLSCSEIGIKEDENTYNVIPPKITDLRIIDSDSAEFDFSSTIQPLKKVFNISPDIGISDIRQEGYSLKIIFSSSQMPGEQYYLKGAVKDSHGNSLTFCAEFYGFNPFIPDLLINEVTTQGSSSHPDLIELYILNSGNMAGVTFYNGCSAEYDEKYVFPSMEVAEGDYIIIHAKPEGISGEITETAVKDESGGKDCHDNAYDIWPSGFSGLSGNNGTLSVYTGPGGTLIDVFLYSNRTSLSDESYRGFGSTSTMIKMDYLSDSGGWDFTGDKIAPEDCVDPDPSTATRSVCRSSSSSDTNSKDDWHTVPTSMSTFGYINSDDVYEP